MPLGKRAEGLGNAKVPLGKAAEGLGRAKLSLGKRAQGLGNAKVPLGKRVEGLGQSKLPLGIACILRWWFSKKRFLSVFMAYLCRRLDRLQSYRAKCAVTTSK